MVCAGAGPLFVLTALLTQSSFPLAVGIRRRLSPRNQKDRAGNRS
jgi:hypothetical protein